MNTASDTAGLTVAPILRDFIEHELLSLLDIDPAPFWRGFRAIIDELGGDNHRLLERRSELQRRISDFHRELNAENWDAGRYGAFLREIGYLLDEGDAFEIGTAGVDPEIATIAGPQLVVPVSNARFALNAANARWGSLYDALYGTDVISSEGKLAPGAKYNPARGAAVIDWANGFLDRHFPLADGRHGEVTEYEIVKAGERHELRTTMEAGVQSALADSNQLAGFREDGGARCILLKHNGLHVELRVDRDHPVGRDAKAGVCDVVLESAITTIQDCEDSVAAVDAEDKVAVYRNWLGLMRGTLEASFEKGGREMTRRLEPDRRYRDAGGGEFTLPGRSLMLVRNVGHLMTTDAVLDAEGEEIFEGMLDAVVTVACAMVDLNGLGEHRNSRSGSIYIVKPKMHGPEEVAFADRLFAAVEDLFGLPAYTLKIGVMDEERRTTLNLHECIRAVRHRLVFINTGFLDRTGDEIHTSMVAGPVLPKEEIKRQPWIEAYEDHNVNVGIRCGLPGRAQIGKGMWPKPDEMAEMMATKAAHCEAGASCAWVPSPTAATLHAVHYHEVDVAARQRGLAKRAPASMKALLSPPFVDPGTLDAAVIQRELDNNTQGILGYVVRWIDHGVGCSKVPDINDVGLMEDRATLRISSQHIANWLYHGVCTQDQVRETFRRMAKIVDRQNAGDPAYRAMSDGFKASRAFRAACDLAFEGAAQPSGYTEPLLHRHRRAKKQEK